MILDYLLKWVGWLFLAVCFLSTGDVINFVARLQEFLLWVMK